MADIAAPKPFFRSRLFWLGLPGLVLLTCCWVAFHGDPVALSWGANNRRTIASVSGVLEVTRITPGSHYHIGHQGLHVGKGIVTSRPNRPMFPPAIEWKLSERQGTLTVSWFSVAVWLVILLHLVIWLLAIFWNERRKGRLLKLSAGKCRDERPRSSAEAPGQPTTGDRSRSARRSDPTSTPPR